MWKHKFFNESLSLHTKILNCEGVFITEEINILWIYAIDDITSMFVNSSFKKNHNFIFVISPDGKVGKETIVLFHNKITQKGITQAKSIQFLTC